MKSKYLLRHVVAVLFALPFIGASAEQAPSRIEVITTFDYPFAGVSTLPQKINQAGDIAGDVDGPTGQVRGFVRSRNGHFSAPIIEPDETLQRTYLRGINSSRVCCGFYLNGLFHGFLVTENTFTQFDVPGAIETELYAINDAGDFCGAASPNNVNFGAFLSISGTLVPISIPDAVTAFAYGINNSNEVVGSYNDSSSIAHGFFRDAAGAVTAPIDPPGAIATILWGLNDQDLIVGRYADSSGVERGFVLQLPDTVLVLEKPGATLTSLNGINNSNVMCGRFEDSSGIAHGIVARLR